MKQIERGFSCVISFLKEEQSLVAFIKSRIFLDKYDLDSIFLIGDLAGDILDHSGCRISRF